MEFTYSPQESFVDVMLVTAIAFALSQVILSGLLLWRVDSWSLQERLYASLLVSVSAYLLAPLLPDGAWLWLTQALQTAVPGLFWLFSASLFDDHFQLRRWQLGLVAATVLLPVAGALLGSAGGSGMSLLLIGLPQLMEFILVGLTLWAVTRYWRVDLIESRRRLRLWFCALNGIYILVLLFLREVVFSPGDRWSTLQYLPLGALLLATNAILLEYKVGILVPPTKSRSPRDDSSENRLLQVPVAAVPIPEISPELLLQLKHLMEHEQVYREMSLTIGQLAVRLDVPEYRLRQGINAGLGYRNFNDFLNTWRVREAARCLASPTDQSRPVLSIAMDCGFRSLSSFNKTFRQEYGDTPTAFRRQHTG